MRCTKPAQLPQRLVITDAQYAFPADPRVVASTGHAILFHHAYPGTMKTTTTRRQALLTIAQLAAATALGACSRSPQTGTGHQDLELVASVAYDILPFPELPPDLYVQAARQMLESGGDELPGGLEALRTATAGMPWKELDEARRVQMLQSIQDSPFFQTLRATTIQVVLRDPGARQIVGYGGSAIEHGGYLHRGFDDISWLPAEQRN